MDKIVHHKLLGIGKLEAIDGQDAIVWFQKRVPLNQIFPSKEAMLGDWKKETLDWLEKYKQGNSG